MDGELKVVIAVCTYKRPKMLAECLKSLEGQGAPIIVVDNDPETHELPDLPANAVLVHEPHRGIAMARNAALKAAIERGYEWLAFIDDDGIANQDWLSRLLDTRNLYSAQAVSGPQFYKYADGVEKWRKRARWDVPRFPEGFRRQIAGTCNLLLDLRFVQKLGLTFEESVGFDGGEDTLFTYQLSENGGKIVWTNRAIVTETVPTERTTLKWYIKMSKHKGRHTIHSAKMLNVDLKPLKAKAARRIMTGVGKFIIVPPAFLIGRGLRTLFSAIRNFSEGIGMIEGFYGVRSRHYETVTGE